MHGQDFAMKQKKKKKWNREIIINHQLQLTRGDFVQCVVGDVGASYTAISAVRSRLGLQPRVGPRVVEGGQSTTNSWKRHTAHYSELKPNRKSNKDIVTVCPYTQLSKISRKCLRYPPAVVSEWLISRIFIGSPHNLGICAINICHSIETVASV